MDEPKSEIDWRAVQTVQLGISAFIVFLMVVIWVATGFGYFWPIWVWFGPRSRSASSTRSASASTARGAGGGSRSTPRCRASSGVILTFIWALTGFGFWLFWPLFGLGGGADPEHARDDVVAGAAPAARRS